jgi:predicted amino acid-binding ACT domain protein
MRSVISDLLSSFAAAFPPRGRKKALMLTATRIPMWITTCSDEPGGMVAKLKPLALAGADLQFLLARRLDGEPGKGVVFLGPINGDARKTAESHGFRESAAVHVLRLSGADEPGLGYLVAQALAAAIINVRAISAMAFHNEFLCYIAFDTEADANRAVEILNAPL